MSTTSSQPLSEQGSNLSAKMTRYIRREMGDSWRHDPKFFKKFFPVRSKNQSQYADIMQKLYNFGRNRWKGIPSKPKSTPSLSRSLLQLLNTTLRISNLYRTRTFFKTHPLAVETPEKDAVTTPSILLAGSGTEFLSTGIDLPFAQYAQAITPVEVRLQSLHKSQGHGRLAVHAHEIFTNQENRRFLFGVVLTEQTITVFMFDHSGAIFSDALDYHLHPDQFCAVTVGLATTDSTSNGFDPTMYRVGRIPKVRTSQSDGTRRTRNASKIPSDGIVYTLKAKIACFSIVVGKGTLCWLVEQDGADSDDKFVVKDSWIAPEEIPGRESEASLLWHVQRSGLVKGLPQIRHCEEVYCGDKPVKDTVMGNRRINGPVDYSIERVHTRLVLSSYGKPLDEFSTRLELLWAFHDAVLAHRTLYERAGILHRDVSVRNILINPDGKEGDRGILIDLDSAIRVDDTSAYSNKRRIGTWPYKSRNVLEGGPHTYSDDLESFFYVICFIVAAYKYPFTPLRPREERVTAWEGEHALVVKHVWFSSGSFDLGVNQWFGEPFRKLCASLHSFFKSRFWEIRRASDNGRTFSQVPAADYETFVSHIVQAISDIEASGSALSSPEASLVPSESAGGGSGGYSDAPKKPRRVRPVAGRIPPVLRPRRSTAKYGYSV